MTDHDLSAGGDVLDRVTACARAALADYGVRPDADVRLLNVSENATFLVTDAGRRTVGAARAPARLPQPAGDRVGAGVDGRAAGRGRGPHPAGAARRRRPPRRERARARRSRGRSAGRDRALLRAVRVPAGDRAARIGRRRGGRRALRRARRDHGPDARARQGLGPAGLVHPVPLGRRRGVRPAAAVGPLAGRPRRRPGRGRGPRAARAQAAGRGSRRSGPDPSGSGWCTPTPGWRTCWSTRAAPRSSTSTTPGSPGTCTTWAPPSASSSTIPPCPAWSPAGWTATGARGHGCPPGTRPRSGRSSCSGGCCWSPGSARTRPRRAPRSSGPATPATAATWPSGTSASH